LSFHVLAHVQLQQLGIRGVLSRNRIFDHASACFISSMDCFLDEVAQLLVPQFSHISGE